MKLRKRTSKKLVLHQEKCLNCGHPFLNREKFCPECGQKNKGKKITFGSFIKEVFNGFISWDAKFWTTIIPLLTKPGKVSKDFVEGKRMRYSNPFQFYLTISIVFFLILGLIESYERFNQLNNGTPKTSVKQILTPKKKPTQAEIDSIKNNVNERLTSPFIPIDSVTKKKILDEIEENAKDTTKNRNRMSFGGTRLDEFVKYHKKYPDSNTDEALDSLGYEKNFKNRFLYDRAKISGSLIKKGGFKKFLNETLSYASISLFILLPIFTLFLKFFYIRRKYTYVEHLIFVFHTQTVFFLLLTVFTIVNFFTKNVESWIFILLFLIYLFIAMKKFYQQGYFKTIIKFCLINMTYLFLAGIGVFILALGSFAFYQG